MHVVRVDVARQAHVSIDRFGWEELQVATRKPFHEPRDLGVLHVVGPAGERARQPGLLVLDAFVGVLERQVVVGVHVEPPEQFLAPRRQRVRTDGLDVDECEQAQHLQPLFVDDQVRELADDLRILGVAPERDSDIFV